MLSIPVFDEAGRPGAEVEVDPTILGGSVRPKLLKQAIVAYQANARQNTSATRSRGMVAGSTRKLYRQKGTGNARVGSRRSNHRRGGGVTFAKGDQNPKRSLNKKMRRLARNNAILAKIKSKDVMVVEGLTFESPSSKRFASMLSAIGAGGSCLFALDGLDESLFRSARNIPRVDICPLSEVNAYSVLRRKKFIMTRPAFDALVRDPIRLQSDSSSTEV